MSINLPNISIPSSSLVLVGIGIVAFFVFLIMARMSRMFLEWNFSGAGLGFFVGILITAAIGGFIVLKGGNLLKNLAMWDQTPEPVKKVLVSSGLVTNVLGSETQKVNAGTVKEDFNSLDSGEKKSVKEYICNP